MLKTLTLAAALAVATLAVAPQATATAPQATATQAMRDGSGQCMLMGGCFFTNTDTGGYWTCPNPAIFEMCKVPEG
jgi:Spy/CpxP family protein refolding chaperone